jgi:hypothetical protein
MFTNKKVDPSAPTYSLEFLLKHPEISTESVPWHVHKDGAEEVTAGQPPQQNKPSGG